MNTAPLSNISTPPPSAPISQPPPLAVLPEPHPAQTRASKPKTRNGKIARLPKLERDMVNRMLADAIPHDRIAEALAKRGFKVTPRNVSNWATRGGYHQWALDQALLVQTRLDQDTLTDFLHDDPTRLPEVGLQIMATRFSQTILHSDLDPKQSLPLLAMLCRISNEILKLHKFRDRRCSFGNPGHQFEREKKENKHQVEILRKFYSGEPVENQPPPKLTIGQLMDALHSGPEAAAALLTRQSTNPPSAAQAHPVIGKPKPAAPAPVPKPPRKPKSKANNPNPPAPSSIQNQNLKIENPLANSQFENQKSKIENSPAPQSSIVELTPVRTLLRFIDDAPQPPPPQYCSECLTPLEFFPDGSPPQPNCPNCNIKLDNLFGSQLERCPACNLPLPPLLPSGLRPKPVCAVCGCGLFTPKTSGPHPPLLQVNARVCIYCRTPIPWQCEGVRPFPYCAKCHRALPRIVYNTCKPVFS